MIARVIEINEFYNLSHSYGEIVCLHGCASIRPSVWPCSVPVRYL